MALHPLFLNYCFDKNRLKSLITWSLLAIGEMRTIQIVENLKELGFRFATNAGISLSLDDLKVPAEKVSLVSQATQQAERNQQEYQRGNLTSIEGSQHLIDTWHRTSETLKQTVINNFQLTDRLSPVYMMAFSGARGNISQVRQLAGMRGLMADPQGQIIGFPIRSNFREGLTLTEYMISCYGARKGLVDTALRTADAGYLTRRLVDVSQHMIVKTATCATSRGILLQDLHASGKTILPLRDRLIGRVLAQDVYKEEFPISGTEEAPASVLSNKKTQSGKVRSYEFEPVKLLSTLVATPKKNSKDSSGDEIQLVGRDSTSRDQGSNLRHRLAHRNQEISAELASQIALSNSWVSVRSPLTCSIRHGVCQLCYGWSLSEGRLVTLGEAVGIIAAQSIGEPGTQLTMRTFHTGGVFSGDVMAEIRSPFDGIVHFPKPLQGLLIRTSHGKITFLTKTEGELALCRTPIFNVLKEAGRMSGSLKLSLLEQQSVLESGEKVIREVNGIVRNRVSTDRADKNLLRAIERWDAHFCLEPATVLFVRHGEKVRQGQLIAEFSSMGPEVNETIEAKRTLFSQIAGQVSFANMAMGTRLKENGEILQLSKNLGFVWVLSGKRSSISPLLTIYNSGSHLVSKNSLITRISVDVNNKNLQARRGKSEIKRLVRQVSFEQAGWKRSEDGSVQSVKKEQLSELLPSLAYFLKFLKKEGRAFKGNSFASIEAAAASITFVPRIVYNQFFSLPSFQLQVSLSKKKFVKAKQLVTTGFGNPNILYTLIPGLVKASSVQLIDFPWLNRVLGHRLNRATVNPKCSVIKEGVDNLAPTKASFHSLVFDVLFVFSYRREPITLCQRSRVLPSIPLNAPQRRRGKASLQGATFAFGWFPKRYRSERGGFAWIDSRYVSQHYTFGEMFLIPEDALTCRLWCKENDQLLQFKKPCEGDDRSFLSNNLPFIQEWRDKNALLIGKKNLQGRKSIQSSCPVGWIKIDAVQYPNTPVPAIGLGDRSMQFGVSRRSTQENTSIGIDSEERAKLYAKHGITHKRDPFTSLSAAIRQGSTFKRLQHGFFQTLGPGKVSFLRPEKGVGLGINSDIKNSLIRPTENRRLAATCYDLDETTSPQPNIKQDFFNPLSRRLKTLNLRFAKDGTFVQSQLTSFKEETETTFIDQVDALAGWVSLPRANDYKKVKENGTRAGFATGLQPLLPSLQPFITRIRVKGRGSRLLDLQQVIPNLARTVDNTREDTQTFLQVKTGWIYYPKDTAKLTVCYGTTQHLDGSSLDRVLFDSAFVYFDVLTSPSFSYNLTNTPLAFSVKLKALQQRGRAASTPFYKGNTLAPDFIFSVFEHMLVQSISSQYRNRNRFKLHKLSKLDLYKNRRLPALMAWKPTFLRYDIRFPFKTNSDIPYSEVQNLEVQNLVDRNPLPDNAVARDLLLFLRKLLWLAEKSIAQYERNLAAGARRPAPRGPEETFELRGNKRVQFLRLKDEEFKQAKMSSFQSLFWRDVANHRQFLWLRAFPLQFQIIVNQKARHQLALLPFALSEETSSVMQNTNRIKNPYVASLVSKRRALASKIQENLFPDENESVLPDHIWIHRIRGSKNPDINYLSTLIRSETMPLCSLPLWRFMAIDSVPKEKESCQSFYKGKDCTLHSTSFPAFVFALIRKAHRYSIEATTKGKSDFLRALQSKGLSYERGGESETVVIGTDLTRQSLWPLANHNATKPRSRSSHKQSTIKINLSAIKGSMAAPSLAMGSNRTPDQQGEGSTNAMSMVLGKVASREHHRPSSKKTFFKFLNKQFPTKLIPQTPRIGFSLKPLLSFDRFQTTSVLKPLQMIRFAAHLTYFSLSEDGSTRKKVYPKLLTSPQCGEMFTQYNQPGNVQGYTNTAAKPFTKSDQILPEFGEIPTFAGLRGPLNCQAVALLSKKGSTNSTLLTEADYVSMSTSHQSPSFGRKLLPVTQRSVGQFLNFGDEITAGHASVVSGQVISIEKGKITFRRTQPLLFYAQGAMHVNHGEWVDKNAPLLTLTYQKLVTGDIVAGIPKIEQFFEAPATKDGEPLSNSLQSKLRKTFHRFKAVLPLAQATKKSLDEIQQILVEGILKVYLSQGVRIADKHLEIVIRQMTSKGHIIDVGNTGLFQGEHVNLHRIERINLATYGEKANYEPAVLGITQASLDSESFISAASFQETTRVLSRDTIVGKTDFLRGLKERVVLGDLIQAGTGLDDNINYGLILGVSMPVVSSKLVLSDRTLLDGNHRKNITGTVK